MCGAAEIPWFFQPREKEMEVSSHGSLWLLYKGCRRVVLSSALWWQHQGLSEWHGAVSGKCWAEDYGKILHHGAVGMALSCQSLRGVWISLSILDLKLR